MASVTTLTGNLVDILNKKIYAAEIVINNKKISHIQPLKNAAEEHLHFIIPGFVDSHVHIESSMLVPSEFARLAVTHGTVATVSDPHEIANVCGIKGVEFMIHNGKQVPFKFNFGAPGCVPATAFETSGSALNSEQVKQLLEKHEIKYLSEMMNFPGVLSKDAEVMKKLEAAKVLGKPVDGHAPGLRGVQAKQYIDAGISTDHECFTKEEALEKLKYGMKILIREGSAAKNFDALIDLLNDYPNEIMFCTDDKHPDSLAEGYINKLCARAVEKGIDIFKVLQAACINPVHHYKLDVGLLREGDAADLIIVKDLQNFEVLATYINGTLVAKEGRSLIASVDVTPINLFNCEEVDEEQLKIYVDETAVADGRLPVIEAYDGQLVTGKKMEAPAVKNNEFVSDIERDILKLVVVNRYKNAPVAKCFIKNFGFKQGAIASSVAHDSHNIIAVGADDESIARAVNLIIKHRGGISCVNNLIPTLFEGGNEVKEKILPLPVAGLMSAEDGYKVAKAYTEIDEMAKHLGSSLKAPFMTLSFMALLVIPHLKLSDLGLFDADSFTFL